MIPELGHFALALAVVIASVRGRLRHQAFHGATELLQIECTDGLLFSVRTAARSNWQGELEFEFDPADAVPVRSSEEA